jgi:hypothetical protein
MTGMQQRARPLGSDKVSQTICLGWLQTAILLIFACKVARITSVSHQCLISACKVARITGVSQQCLVYEIIFE